MALRYPLVAGGVGLTTFGLVAVAVIELVEVDPGAGILGVGLGALAGMLAFVLVFMRLDTVTRPVGLALHALAAFGYAVLGVLFVSYANVGGLRPAITATTAVLAGVVVAVLVGVGSWLRS